MTSRYRIPPRRSGTILVVALVVLTVVILLSASLARAVVIFHQQAQMGERRQQALLLAESGIQRAIQAASTADGYQGETWRVPAPVFGDTAAGIVVIRVEKPAEPAELANLEKPAKQRRVFVEASYPEQGTRRFVYRRELLIDVPVPVAAPAANSPT